MIVLVYPIKKTTLSKARFRPQQQYCFIILSLMSSGSPVFRPDLTHSLYLYLVCLWCLLVRDWIWEEQRPAHRKKQRLQQPTPEANMSSSRECLQIDWFWQLTDRFPDVCLCFHVKSGYKPSQTRAPNQSQGMPCFYLAWPQLSHAWGLYLGYTGALPDFHSLLSVFESLSSLSDSDGS